MKALFISIIIIGAILRLAYLTSIPPALHGDELGTGYNALSLLTTGRDEYGKLLPLTFRNDFSPIIFYATIPFVTLFGLTDFATRLPSAIVGILILPFIYLFCLILYKNHKLSLLFMYLTSLSSWHIRTSRLALEMQWALFFQLVAILFFLKGKTPSKIFYLVSFIFFGLSILAYQSAKMTTPFLIIGLFIIYWRVLVRKNLRFFLVFFAFFVSLPLISYFFVKPLPQWRFVGISVFTEWKNSLPPGTRLLSIRPQLLLWQKVLGNYLKHFDPQLLFFDNSNLRYFQISHIGLYYLWQSVFILIGLLTTLARANYKENKILLLWLFLSPLPASLTTGVPHANIGRNLMILPVIEMLTAKGIIQVTRFFSKLDIKILKLAFPTAMATLSVATISIFLHQYFIKLPERYAQFWGKPFREAVSFIRGYQDDAKEIIFTNENPQSYMYLLYYRNKSPQWLLAQKKERANIVGYSRIGQYQFRPIDIKADQMLAKTLLIGTAKEIPADTANIIGEIKSNHPEGEVYLRIVKTDL